MKRPHRIAPTVLLLAAALLAGGLRDPRAFILGAVALGAVLWRRRPPVGPAAAWLPWLAWAMLGGLTCAEPLASLAPLARWGFALGAFALAADWNAEERVDWATSLFVGAAILALAALFSGGMNGRFRETMTGLLPPYYNYTAFALAAAAAGGGAWALHPRAKGRRWIAGAVGLSVVSIILAHSRGAQAGLAAAGAVWAWRRFRWRGLGAAAAVAGSVVAVALSTSAGREALFKSARARGEARPGIWLAATEIAAEHPWLGVGPGLFRAGFRLHPVPSPGAAARWGMETDFAHSEPLQAAAETGWVGFALWSAAMGWGLSTLLTAATAEPAREAAAAAAAAMATQGLFDNALQLPGLAALFFSALAVAGARPRTGRRWPRAAVVVVAAFSVAAWLPEAVIRPRLALAVKLLPAEPDVFEATGITAARQGRWMDADAAWAKAQALAPFNAVHPLRRAAAAARNGDFAAAEALSARAVALEPGFLRARLLRAQTMVHRGRRRAAAEEAVEIRRRLAASETGELGSRYEVFISGFDEGERRALTVVETAARRLK